jgi:DNA-binding transcriptional ArsR family regulator
MIKYKYEHANLVDVDNGDILEQLFDTKILRILRLFIENEDSYFYLREVAVKAKVSPATTYRTISKLIRLEVIALDEVKTLKQYRLATNKKTDFLKTIIKKDKRAIDIFVERVKDLPGVDMVLMHGKQKDGKANILVLGKDVDANQVKAISYEVKDQFGFTILSLALSHEQFDQMSQMGLYSGEKSVLFTRQ